jgi:hypothetical protein
MEITTSDAPVPEDESAVESAPAQTKDEDTVVASVTTDPAPAEDTKQSPTTESKFVPMVPNELSVDNGASVQSEMLKEQLPEATDPDEGADAAREALMSGALPQVSVANDDVLEVPQDVPSIPEDVQETEESSESAAESEPKASGAIQVTEKPSEPAMHDESKAPETARETSTPSESTTGNKRKADDIETELNDPDSATTDPEVAAVEKKVKKNDGTPAALERKNSKGAKSKKVATAVGRTERKTRSQGPA